MRVVDVFDTLIAMLELYIYVLMGQASPLWAVFGQITQATLIFESGLDKMIESPKLGPNWPK